jgi:hypothetical protein
MFGPGWRRGEVSGTRRRRLVSDEYVERRALRRCKHWAEHEAAIAPLRRRRRPVTVDELQRDAKQQRDDELLRIGVQFEQERLPPRRRRRSPARTRKGR